VNTPNSPAAKKAHTYAEGRAEELGREAWAAQKPRAAPPHLAPNMRKAWIKGYDAARDESGACPPWLRRE